MGTANKWFDGNSLFTGEEFTKIDAKFKMIRERITELLNEIKNEIEKREG